MGNKVHIPIGGNDLMCGSNSFVAAMSTNELCTKCVNRMERMINLLSDEQLKKMGFTRTEESAFTEVGNKETP